MAILLGKEMNVFCRAGNPARQQADYSIVTVTPRRSRPSSIPSVECRLKITPFSFFLEREIASAEKRRPAPEPA